MVQKLIRIRVKHYNSFHCCNTSVVQHREICNFLVINGKFKSVNSYSRCYICLLCSLKDAAILDFRRVKPAVMCLTVMPVL